MSTQPTTKNTSVELTDEELLRSEKELERQFWTGRNIQIYNLFVSGKAIYEIAELCSIRPLTVEKAVIEPYFMKRLESHLRSTLFTTQVSKVLCAADIFNKLWSKVSDNMADIAPEIALKELTKLIQHDSKGSVKILNPENINIFLNKLEEAKQSGDFSAVSKDLEADFGYTPLEESDSADYLDDEPSTYSKQ